MDANSASQWPSTRVPVDAAEGIARDQGIVTAEDEVGLDPEKG